MAERLNQKSRTRAALLEAAAGLIRGGVTPSVAEVAEAARVSRATAYRYFPTQESLLVEAPLDQEAPTVTSLFSGDGPEPPGDRAALVQNALYDLARDNERQFRLLLRASLDRWLREDGQAGRPLRGARRDVLLDEALAPVRRRLQAGDYERLKASLAVLVGIESVIVLRDVLDLDHDEARETMEWAVRTLVRTVVPA